MYPEVMEHWKTIFRLPGHRTNIIFRESPLNPQPHTQAPTLATIPTTETATQFTTTEPATPRPDRSTSPPTLRYVIRWNEAGLTAFAIGLAKGKSKGKSSEVASNDQAKDTDKLHLMD